MKWLSWLFFYRHWRQLMMTAAVIGLCACSTERGGANHTPEPPVYPEREEGERHNSDPNDPSAPGEEPLDPPPRVDEPSDPQPEPPVDEPTDPQPEPPAECIGEPPNTPCKECECNAEGQWECTPVSNGTPCDADPVTCTVQDSCQNGVCVAGPPAETDDGNPCTSGVCVKGVVQQKALGGPCSDGNPCTGGDTCTLGQCVPDTLVDCPEETCSTAWCNPMLGGCTYEPVADGTPCNAGDLCGDQGTCQNSQCLAGTAVVCDDGDPCTADTCDPTDGCLFEMVENCGNSGYATWNPDDKQKNIQLSNGLLTAAVDADSVNDTVRATQGKSAGRWYWEVSIEASDGGTYNGVCVADAGLNLELSPGMSQPGINYKRQGTIVGADDYFKAAAYGNEDLVGVALDADAMQVYFHVNGVWQLNANPETFTGGLALGIDPGEPAFPCVNISQFDVYSANFGQQPFAYEPPNGFAAGVFDLN